METTLQVNRSIEITTGKWTQQITDLDMVKREFLMELLSHFMPKDTKSNTQRPSLFKRQLRIRRLLPLISSASLRILDRVRTIEVKNLFMASKMLLLETHGMLPGAFMVSQLRRRCNQITILEKV
jgi:hypothetical protein